MTLNREHFEAWLFSQPKERTFRFLEGTDYDPVGCVFCNYFREATNEKRFVVSELVLIPDRDWNKKVPLPEWAQQFSILIKYFNTFGQAQATYLSLFPDTLSDTPSLPGAKAGILSSEQRESTQGKIDSHQTKTQK